MDAWVWGGIAGVVWVIGPVVYLRGLLRVLMVREGRLRLAVDEVTERARGWQQALELSSHREWREAAESIARALEAQTGEFGLRENLRCAEEIGRLLEEGERLVAREPRAFGADVSERAAHLRAALEELSAAAAAYWPAAHDAAFARERFPISLMARLVGLSGRPAAL